VFIWLLLGFQAIVSAAGVLVLRFAMPQILGKVFTLTWPLAGWAILGIVLYGGSFLLWLFILSKNPVSFAYPIAVGVTLTVTVLGAYFVLGEKITIFQVCGIALMLVAVVLLSLSGAPEVKPTKLLN
jgi:drug/metabolite transporter (DMT)-like permease